MESCVHYESGAVARSDSLPSSLTATPDLDRSSFVSDDLATPSRTCAATDRAMVSKAPTWHAIPQETAFTQNHTWMPYLNAKEPMLPFLESMETKPASVGAGLPPSWLSPVSLSPCDSPLTQDDHTPPPKRMRSESHAPNHRRSSTPARPASDTESLRAWLLQRRAQLQQKQADIRQAQDMLKEQQGHWAHVQTLLSARIAKLSQNRTLAPTPSSPSLGLLGSEELDDPLWDAAPVSSVADLLEQNILCL